MRLKALTHGSQREPGTVWDEPDNIAEVLIKLGHAKKADDAKTYETRAVKPVETKVEAPDEMGELRSEYERVVGRRPFMGWDAETLREKIADYNRRDMRAED